MIWQGAAISASIRAWSLAGFAVRSRCSLRGGLTSQLIGVHSTDKVAAALRPPPAASLRHARIDTLITAPTAGLATTFCYTEMRNVPISERERGFEDFDSLAHDPDAVELAIGEFQFHVDASRAMQVMALRAGESRGRAIVRQQALLREIRA